jgi:hypothetical protein
MLFKEHKLRHQDKVLRAWAEGLVRLIQTTIETIRVENSTDVEMRAGHIVKLVKGKRQCRLATEADAVYTGVLSEDCSPQHGALCRTSNLACVMFAKGQVPVEGELAYLGAEPGVAYTEGQKPIGEIADASRFSEKHPFAKVVLMRLGAHQVVAPVGAEG